MANKGENARRKQNVSNKEQLRYMTEVLETLFFWPKGDDPNNVNSKLYFRAIIFSIMAMFPISLCICHAYHFRSVANSSLIIDLTISAVLFDFTLVTTIFMNNLKKMVMHVNCYYKEKYYEKEPFQNTKLDYKMLSKMTKISLMGLVISFSLLRIFDNENCQKRNTTNNNSLEPCGLLIGIYLPFDYDFFPLKQYILIHQAVGSYIVFNGLIHGILIPVFHVDKTVGAIDYMIGLVRRLNSSVEDDKKVKDYLRKIVNIHEIVVRENKAINDVLRHIFMIQLIFGRLIIAASIFDVLETGSVMSMVHCSGWIIFAAVAEFGGQYIINKSADFENALLNVKWYEIKRLEYRRSFLLIFSMSQRSIALDAGLYAKFSLPSFLQFIQATYSGTAMLVKLVK